ncbi:MAG: hypothetical protein V6Z82_01600 [Flavobacteriales bacterium]
MDRIREKSELNEAAAELLIRESLHAPAVHCSYYSCFQLMKYTLKSALRISYKRQDRESQNAQGGSHLYVRDHIVKKLVTRKEKNRFIDKFKDLKHRRKESDYRNIEIDRGKSETALRKAREIKRYLIQKFQL